ncbi:MAG: GtrA family protein [Bacteroidales bacterium]|jgi:putative flippase GtrA|nr:GtrA family protein [Bacteroidales bacterium]
MTKYTNSKHKWLHKIFIEKTNNFFVQFFRYFFVGGLAFLVDFAALALFTEVCHFHYIISNTISFTLGLLVNYFISVLWVFNNSNVKNRKLEFVLFAIIGIIGLGINDLALWIFTHGYGIFYLLSKVLAAMVSYLWNFLARKYFLFNNKKNE